MKSNVLKQYQKSAGPKNNAGTGTPQPGEIWWVSNLEGIKDRPVLIMGHNGNTYSYRKCTSQLSPTRNRYVIEDYLEAGLDKQTYVDPEIRNIDRNRIVRKIGELSDYDRGKFFSDTSV